MAPAGVAPVVAANVTGVPGGASVTAAYRGLSAADDEAEEPRYNSCGASAASFRSLAAEPDEAYIQIPPLMRANAGTLMLG